MLRGCLAKRELRCLRGEAEQPTKGVITSGCKALTFQNSLPPPIMCFLRPRRPFLGRELGWGERQNKRPLQHTRAHARGFARQRTEELFVP